MNEINSKIKFSIKKILFYIFHIFSHFFKELFCIFFYAIFLKKNSMTVLTYIIEK